MLVISLPSPCHSEVPTHSVSGQQSSSFLDPWQVKAGSFGRDFGVVGKVRGKHTEAVTQRAGSGGLSSILPHVCNGSFAHATPHPSLVGEKEQRVGWYMKQLLVLG